MVGYTEAIAPARRLCCEPDQFQSCDDRRQLLQPRILRFGVLQDRDVGVGVLLGVRKVCKGVF